MGQPLLGTDPRRTALAGAVQLMEGGVGERRHHLALDRHRAGCAAVDHQGQAVHVDGRPSGLGQLEHPDEVRRDHERTRAAVSGDRTQKRLRLEPRRQHGGGADVERGQTPSGVRRVIARTRHDVDIVGAPFPQLGLTAHAGMTDLRIPEAGVHHALRPCRRARRIEDELGPGPAVPRGAARGGRHQRLVRGGLVRTTDENPGQTRARLGQLVGHVVVTDHDGGTRILQEIGQLG